MSGSETVYFKDKHERVLDHVEETAPGVTNRSQAVQYVINAFSQHEQLNGDSNE